MMGFLLTRTVMQFSKTWCGLFSGLAAGAGAIAYAACKIPSTLSTQLENKIKMAFLTRGTLRNLTIVGEFDDPNLFPVKIRVDMISFFLGEVLEGIKQDILDIPKAVDKYGPIIIGVGGALM